MRITEDELKGLLKDAAKAGVEEYKRQEKKARRQDRYHDTYNLMRRYRDALYHAQHAATDQSRLRTEYTLERIDTAVAEVQRKCEAAGRDMEYKAFTLYFMDGKTYEQIAEALDTGKNTPRRWVGYVINELSVLLWGLDEW